MEALDTSYISNLLQAISPFAVTMAVTFATAEFIFQWFIRVAFGKFSSNRF